MPSFFVQRALALISVILCTLVLQNIGEPNSQVIRLTNGLVWAVVLNAGLLISTFPFGSRLKYYLAVYNFVSSFGVAFLPSYYGWIVSLPALFLQWWLIYRMLTEREKGL